MGQILIGLSSWADPNLIESGFYPPEVRTPESRLQHYAANFPLVEMDAAYHVMPGRRNTEMWLAATPPKFVFDIKVFSLFTHHPTQLTAVPRDLREEAKSGLRKANNLYIEHLPEKVADELWERFAASVRPFHESGKMGLLLFQFPPWFHRSPENYEYIAKCREKLPDYRMAVEFRTTGWLNEEHREYTLQFLREKGISLVCLDDPVGGHPFLAEITGEVGAVGFHGRGAENEKANYLYTREELLEWTPRIRRMAEQSAEVHVIFKNKWQDYAVRNAREMREILG